MNYKIYDRITGKLLQEGETCQFCGSVTYCNKHRCENSEKHIIDGKVIWAHKICLEAQA